MLTRTLFIIALQFVNLALGLNVLLSSKDSWVSKNTRHLYAELRDQGHNVKLVAPLNNGMHVNGGGLSSEETKDVKRDEAMHREVVNGGDFGHLLPVHQTYYRTIKKLNSLPRGAKNVILKKHLDETEETTESAQNFNNNYFGHDPLDESIWYVNASPLETLLIAYDVLLPQFLPDFKPDLVILGPDEGLSLTPSVANELPLFHNNHPNMDDGLDAMMRLTMMKKYPVIGVSTGDDHHIYFQDENYFNIQQNVLSKQLSKKNVFTKNIKFINNKVVELINKLSASSTILPENVSLNVNFPSMNHDVSHCTTSLKNNVNNPKFQQVAYNKKNVPVKTNMLPKYELVDGRISINGNYDVNANLAQDIEQQTFVDKKSYYYSHILKREESSESTEAEGLSQDYSDNDDLNKIMNNIDELNVLKDCGISVSVNHLINGNGLDKDFLDLESLLN